MANSFGHYFRIHTFGESHGTALGVVIDGCPSGVVFKHELLKNQLQRRRPGHSAWVSSRGEADEYELLSGVFEGKTLGTPIALIVRNHDQRSEDYSQITSGDYRQGHADKSWSLKYSHVDLRGGGRASARETVSRVLAGAVAEMFLKTLYPTLEVCAFVESIGPWQLSEEDKQVAVESSFNSIDQFVARFPSKDLHEKVGKELKAAKESGESFGGTATLVIRGMPASLGEPVFLKLKSQLAMAMLSIGASLGVEFADAFSSVHLPGTKFHSKESNNQYAGMNGGISTSEVLKLKVAFKPTSSILSIAKKGRHDPCILPRAIPVMEAMAQLVLADLSLAKRLNNI